MEESNSNRGNPASIKKKSQWGSGPDPADESTVVRPRKKTVPVELPWTRISPPQNVDFETYVRLKREERQLISQFHAATIIQSAWRGFLVRFNLRIVVESIIKIQTALRGYIARKRVKTLAEERVASALTDSQEKAARKIQAAWRGYWSRKTKLDYASYKDIQLKNEALRQSIERINELEAVLLQTLEAGKGSQESFGGSGSGQDSRKHSQVSGIRSQRKTGKAKSYVDPCAAYAEAQRLKHELSAIHFDNLTPSLENMIIDKLPELVDEMSETRIAELYAYLANLETEMQTGSDLEKQVERMGGVQNLNPEQLYRLEESRRKQKERANLILDLAKMGMMGPLKKKYLPRPKDSVDKMFPPLPDRGDLVQPDKGKVESLKRAIRMFRQRSEMMEEWELKKKHVLLRTSQVPGVFSDIYTTELTEIEKRLKSVKYWKGSMAADRLHKKGEASIEAKNQRLRLLFTHALRISARKDTPSSNGTADDEEEFDELEEAMGLAIPEDYIEYGGESEIPPELEENEDEPTANESEGASEDKTYYLPPLQPPTAPVPPPPTPSGTDDLTTTTT